MNQFDLDHGRPAEPGLSGGLEPLHAHDADAPESGDLTVGRARRRRRVGAGTLLFAVVALASFGSLWSMRAIGRAGAATAEASEAGRLVESYLNEQTKSQAGASARDLSTAPLPVGSAEDVQIPRERLARDPFAASWRQPVVAASGAADATVMAVATTPAVSDIDAQIAAWEALVDEGARDFTVKSVLLAPDPALSIVNMNGGVFRIGESVALPDRPIRYEIRAVEPTAVTLVASNPQLSRERTVRLVIRERH